MLFVFIAVGVLALLWTSLLAYRAMRPDFGSPLRLLQQQQDTLSGTLGEFIEQMTPTTICYPPCNSPASQEIWDCLRQDDNVQALRLAEAAMASDSESPEPRLLLAMVLCAGAHYAPAHAQLAAAKTLGAIGPLLEYLESTIEVAEYLDSFVDPHSTTEYSAVLPVELLAMQLRTGMEDSRDTPDLWLPGNNTQVDKEDVSVFVVTHFTRYYAILATMLKSLHTTPYNDGFYFIARLALASGFPKEGYAFYCALEDRMSESAHRRRFQRELAMIRGQSDWKYQSIAGKVAHTRLRVLP